MNLNIETQFTSRDIVYVRFMSNFHIELTVPSPNH